MAKKATKVTGASTPDTTAADVVSTAKLMEENEQLSAWLNERDAQLAAAMEEKKDLEAQLEAAQQELGQLVEGYARLSDAVSQAQGEIGPLSEYARLEGNLSDRLRAVISKIRHFSRNGNLMKLREAKQLFDAEIRDLRI